MYICECWPAMTGLTCMSIVRLFSSIFSFSFVVFLGAGVGGGGGVGFAGYNWEAGYGGMRVWQN